MESCVEKNGETPCWLEMIFSERGRVTIQPTYLLLVFISHPHGSYKGISCGVEWKMSLSFIWLIGEKIVNQSNVEVGYHKFSIVQVGFIWEMALVVCNNEREAL